MLLGRAEMVTREIETRSKAAAELLSARMEQLSSAITTNAGEAQRSLELLTTTTTQAIRATAGDAERVITTSAAASNDSMRTTATDVERSLTALSSGVSNVLKQNASEVERTLLGVSSEVTRNFVGKADEITSAIGKRSADLTQIIDEKSSGLLAAMSAKSAEFSETMRASTADVEHSLTSLSTGVSNVLKQNASEVERTLLGISSEVARNFVGKADEITSAVGKRSAELTQILDERSSGLLAAISAKSGEFTGEISRATDSAVKAIESKGFAFTSTMMDNSSELARVINEASLTATGAVNRSMKELQEIAGTVVTQSSSTINRSIKELQESASTVVTQSTGTISRSLKELTDTTGTAVTQSANAVNRTVKELQDRTQGVIEQSRQTATATVAEILETHGMLRSDSTALFERLRDANSLLQEVLSGAQNNMGAIEQLLSSRVTEFVSTMNNLLERTGATTTHMDEHISSFYGLTTKVLGDLGDLAGQFDLHGKSLVEAVELLDKSNRRTEDLINERRTDLDGLMTGLDIAHRGSRSAARRFSGLLDESLVAAESRARDIARIVAEIERRGRARHRRTARGGPRSPPSRNASAPPRPCVPPTSRRPAMRRRCSGRPPASRRRCCSMPRNASADIVQGMKQMAAEMQRELELDPPGAAARHPRTAAGDRRERRADASRDRRPDRGAGRTQSHRRPPWPQHRHRGCRAGSSHPARRGGGGQHGGRSADARPVARGDITGAPSQTAADFRSGAPESPLAQPGPPPAQPRSGWLTDLLSRASRDEEAPRGDERPQRSDDRTARPDDRPPGTRSSRSTRLSVDIARMIDHDAAAELWDRYNRGERNVFTRRLYTMQGQKTFDDIRKRYRADREFKQTVDRYIGEFERLLEEVSRDDRGQVVARTYLTSETGKVYTMLAHAAGRFE